MRVAEEPYRVPTCPDMKHVGALIHGRLNQALDHLHALHEDPAYFAEIFEQGRENYLWHLVRDSALTENV